MTDRQAGNQPSVGASSHFERRSRRSSKHQEPRELPLRPWTHQVECGILGKRERKLLSRIAYRDRDISVSEIIAEFMLRHALD